MSRIIDFHTHTFPDRIAGTAIQKLKANSGTENFLSGTAEALSASCARAGVDAAVILPVVTNPQSAAKINQASAALNVRFPETHLLSFGGIHPDTPDAKAVLAEAAAQGLRGIKIHPPYQQVAFNDIRYKRLIAWAEELGLVVVTHGGIDIGVPGDWCTPAMVREVLHEVQPTRLVVAHMGGWQQWEQVLDLLCGEPVFLDTAFSYGSFAYRPEIPEAVRYRPLTEDQMVTLIRAHGARRILFGTDSPWSDQKEQIHLIRSLPLTGEEKESILGENGARLLGNR